MSLATAVLDPAIATPGQKRSKASKKGAVTKSPEQQNPTKVRVTAYVTPEQARALATFGEWSGKDQSTLMAEWIDDNCSGVLRHMTQIRKLIFDRKGNLSDQATQEVSES